MEKEIVERMLELTDEQQKAWNRLVKAHKDFLKAGGGFYQVLNCVSGFNKKYVDKIENIHHITDDYFLINDDCDMPVFFDFGACSFADDWHGVILNSKGRKLLEQKKLSSEG